MERLCEQGLRSSILSGRNEAVTGGMEGWANPEVFPGGGETGAESYGLEESEKVTWRRKEGGRKPQTRTPDPGL